MIKVAAPNMACRVIDWAVLRNIRKCSEDPNLDAVSVYVLVAIVKKQLALDASLYTLLQILSVTHAPPLAFARSSGPRHAPKSRAAF
jgi:hypothetical protein